MSTKIHRIKSGKMIKLYLKIFKHFTRPYEFLPDMSSGQTETGTRLIRYCNTQS